MATSALPDALFLALQSTLAGRYSLERELGRGGMGIVYLARDVRLDRLVALKLLPPDRAIHPELRDKFLHEARMAARLAHPNIVPIHAVEEVGDFVFYAMRYVDGETLGDRLRLRHHLATAEAARVLTEIAYALAYAHAQGVIHRDIKPDNILLDKNGDRAMVTDFGIAQLVDDADISGSRIVGTPEYLSPEQAMGQRLDARSDLYSLGAVGYHCLGGRAPFEGTPQELIAKHLTQSPLPLGTLAPEAPHQLTAAIERALAKSPDARFANAEDFAEMVSQATKQSDELPVPVRVWVERGRELKSIYVIWSCGFYGLSVLGAISVFLNGWGGGGWFMFVTSIMGIAPWLGHGIWRIAQTRMALESGVTIDDLRYGVAVALERREEELRYEATRAVHPISRMVRYGTFVAMLASFSTLLGGLVGAFHSRGVLQLFALSTAVTVAGMLFGVIFPGRRRKPIDRWLRWRRSLWNSRLGTFLSGISAIGLPANRPQSPRLAFTTELALRSATDTLYAALSDADRRALSGLPDVVNRLERAAAHARAQIALGMSGDWEVRLEQAVAAIETLRIGMLRMNSEHLAATSITADLASARELSERIGYLVAGAAEVADALRAEADTRHQSIQPAPTAQAPSTSLG